MFFMVHEACCCTVHDVTKQDYPDTDKNGFMLCGIVADAGKQKIKLPGTPAILKNNC